jgi:hypothetical protein
VRNEAQGEALPEENEKDPTHTWKVRETIMTAINKALQAITLGEVQSFENL